MRAGIALLLCSTILAGCGLMARKEREEQMAVARSARDQGMAACAAQFPENSKDYVAKNKCLNDAAMPIRAVATYPDLFDRYWAFRGVIAEKMQSGKISPAEAKEQIAENDSQITNEEQQRNLANRSVGAQETMAAAAWRATGPRTCTSGNGISTCF